MTASVDSTLARIDALLDEWDIRRHPFCRMLFEGQLSREAISGYALSVYQENTQVGTAMYALAFNCPDVEVRSALAANIAGEEVGVGEVASHGNLAMRFALACGLSREQVLAATPLMEHAAQIGYIRDVASNRPWLEALVAIALGRERNFSAYCAGVATALRTHYGFSAADVAYFSQHVEGPGSDEEHEHVGREVLARYFEPAAADRLVQAALTGVFGHWLWHDGVYREYVLGVPRLADALQPAGAAGTARAVRS